MKSVQRKVYSEARALLIIIVAYFVMFNLIFSYLCPIASYFITFFPLNLSISCAFIYNIRACKIIRSFGHCRTSSYLVIYVSQPLQNSHYKRDEFGNIAKLASSYRARVDLFTKRSERVHQTPEFVGFDDGLKVSLKQSQCYMVNDSLCLTSFINVEFKPHR